VIALKAAKIIFVTGTDTGVGKTVLTALLLHHLRSNGVRALAMKPFCSGGLGDVRLLQSLQKGELSDREMNPYFFGKPLAPLVAAKKGAKPIRSDQVVQKIQRIAMRCDCLLIEGSGGLLVPLGPNFSVADLIKRLKCAVVIAARNRLGTINHTLLTVSALREKGISFNNQTVVLMPSGKKDLSSRTNVKVLDRLLTCPVVEIPDLGTMSASTGAICRGGKKYHGLLDQIVRSFGVHKLANAVCR
jgi:dethiobiotin synthetase